MDGAIDWLVGPYQYTFMQRAALVLVIISVVSGVVGTFVVHKGLAFSGDALAHSTLAGVAMAFVAGLSISLGALAAAVVTALGIAWTRDRARVSYDTAIGTVWHFDLYRIEAPGELAEIGLDAALEEGVLLVEWPDRLAGRLPADRLDVAIEALDGSRRRIAWQGHGSRGRTLAAALAAAAA